MPPRLRVLGWVHVAFGLIGLGLAGALLAAAGLSNDAAYADEAGFLLVWAGLFSAAYFVPSFLAGLGVLRGRLWARFVLWVEAALLIVFIPIGPVLAGFTVWVLLTTREASWSQVGMIDIRREVMSRLHALVLIMIGLAIFAAIMGAGWLLRDVIDPPRAQELTPMPSGVPPQVSPVQPTLP